MKLLQAPPAGIDFSLEECAPYFASCPSRLQRRKQRRVGCLLQRLKGASELLEDELEAFAQAGGFHVGCAMLHPADTKRMPAVVTTRRWLCRPRCQGLHRHLVCAAYGPGSLRREHQQ